MNKLDKQFEEMMKGIRIDSPSKGFSLEVMERIQAETATLEPSILENYQPVISRKVWIFLIAAFIFIMVYITVSSPEANQVKEPEIWSALSESLQKVDIKGVSTIWESVTGLFTSIPTMAYLILTASMALWTLDSFLQRLRHSATEVHIG